MLNADTAPYFATCPRCGTGGYEQLATHSYCYDCNYSPVESSYEMSIPEWVLEFLKTAKPKSLVKLFTEDEFNPFPMATNN